MSYTDEVKISTLCQTFRAPDMCFNLAIYSLFNVQSSKFHKKEIAKTDKYSSTSTAKSKTHKRPES